MHFQPKHTRADRPRRADGLNSSCCIAAEGEGKVNHQPGSPRATPLREIFSTPQRIRLEESQSLHSPFSERSTLFDVQIIWRRIYYSTIGYCQGYKNVAINAGHYLSKKC